MMKNFRVSSRVHAIDRRGFLTLSAGALTVALHASRASAQGGRTRAGCVDCHAHWEPEPYVKAMADLGTKISLKPLDIDLDKRLSTMDGRGVRMELLTLNSPPWQIVSAADGARLAQIVNDAAIEAHTKYPDRFVAGVTMPIQDPALALKELNRVAGKPGMRAVHLVNNYKGDYLFQPAFAPILARAEELGYPLVFHPAQTGGGVIGGERLEQFFLFNTIGFPVEHATTAAKFILTGTLDKFPKLEILLSHAGGVFPYIAGRIEHSLNRRSAGDVKLARPYKEYIRRFHYDTITYYPETLRFLISLVGIDRVVVGTDNFAIMDVDKPSALVEEMNLSASDRALILEGNAKRLFRL